MIRFVSSLCLLAAVASGATIPSAGEPGIEGHIVGGKPTKIEEVPYQVALYHGSRFTCGGSIVSSTFVVTAAHCVTWGYSSPRVTFNIRAGSSSRIAGGVMISAKNVTHHPKYNSRTTDYDVAVIELSVPLQFNNSIKAIKVADKEPSDGAQVKASGWGCQKENGLCPAMLQSVDVPMVNRKTCDKNYSKYMKITNRMICAGVEGKDACQGDSGGPLAYKNTLVGVVSTGEGCGRKDLPGIYTNVADPEIRDFIKKLAKV